MALPLLVVLVGSLLIKVGPMFRSLQEKTDALNLVVQENLTGIRVVKSFVREDHEREKFARRNLDLKRTSERAFGMVVINMPQPQRGVAETTDDLAAGGIDSPFQPHGLAVVGQDQFVLRTGHLKLLHMAAQLLDLFIGKPVTEIYILVERVRLAVDAS